jgi:AbrB family looped-hinge helix DNA binding protein
MAVRRFTMATVETTKMSSKGQIVIPEEIRKRLGLRSGDKFLVVGDRDVVILKSISAPSIDEFDDLITKARKQAEVVGMKRSDIAETVAKYRGRK